jgi:hypothetical protein
MVIEFPIGIFNRLCLNNLHIDELFRTIHTDVFIGSVLNYDT